MPGGNARHWNNNWEGIIRTPDAGNGNQHLALVLVLWELHHLVLGVSHGLFLSSATRATRRQGPYSSPLLCRKRSLGPPSKHITSAQPGHTHDRATRRAAYFVHCMPTRVRYDGGVAGWCLRYMSSDEILGLPSSTLSIIHFSLMESHGAWLDSSTIGCLGRFQRDSMQALQRPPVTSPRRWVSGRWQGILTIWSLGVVPEIRLETPISVRHPFIPWITPLAT
ncbi:hypothetical protein EV126DRAFT_53631 [Verticillium dahliae]|nr:hypothetical protein EV126DRAFT_53631 [Verticillium dahliae]